MNRTEFSNNNATTSQSKIPENNDWSTSSYNYDSLINIDNHSIENLRQQEKQIIRDQDSGLEDLSKSISKQMSFAIKMISEVDNQNVIIDDISNKMERTNNAIQSRTNQVEIISRRESTCGYWMVIILLGICIIGVILI